MTPNIAGNSSDGNHQLTDLLPEIFCLKSANDKKIRCSVINLQLGMRVFTGKQIFLTILFFFWYQPIVPIDPIVLSRTRCWPPHPKLQYPNSVQPLAICSLQHPLPILFPKQLLSRFYQGFASEWKNKIWSTMCLFNLLFWYSGYAQFRNFN